MKEKTVMERLSDLDNIIITPDKFATMAVFIFTAFASIVYALLFASVTAWFIAGLIVGGILGQIQTWLQMYLWMKKARKEMYG